MLAGSHARVVIAGNGRSDILGLLQNLWVRMYSSAPDYADGICVYEQEYEYGVCGPDETAFSHPREFAWNAKAICAH